MVASTHRHVHMRASGASDLQTLTCPRYLSHLQNWKMFKYEMYFHMMHHRQSEAGFYIMHFCDRNSLARRSRFYDEKKLSYETVYDTATSDRVMQAKTRLKKGEGQS